MLIWKNLEPTTSSYSSTKASLLQRKTQPMFQPSYYRRKPKKEIASLPRSLMPSEAELAIIAEFPSRNTRNITSPYTSEERSISRTPTASASELSSWPIIASLVATLEDPSVTNLSAAPTSSLISIGISSVSSATVIFALG